jgi:integrase
MGRKKDIPYLLHERGRFFYQRRVPKHLHQTVGVRKWHRPAGTNYAKAVAQVVAWADEDDKLIANLSDPDTRQEYRTHERREREMREAEKNAADDLAYREWLENNGEEDPGFFGEDPLSEHLNRNTWRELHWMLPAFEERYKSVYNTEVIYTAEGEFERKLPIPKAMDRDESYDYLVALNGSAFGPHAEMPTDPDERTEFDVWKMRLERKIARVAPAKDTLKGVAERYFSFVDSKPATLRHINALVDQVGNVPIHHVTATMLREHRDRLMARMIPSSVHAHFTPIKGLFAYAIDEELVDTNPVAGVRLPRDKRSVEEVKWLPFSPSEMSGILSVAAEYWGQPIAGVSRERREALLMLTRVLAYTAMRPIEIMSLRPENVDEMAIQIEGGKTKSAWRVVPLHPAIRDFPAWLRGSGMETFAEIKTDPVTPLRQNFSKLIRKRLSPPVIEERKALYSLRSTFSNAMRRAGAPADIRRAILGHAEGGALRHYDDGPEFDLKREWIEKTDPCRD